MINVLAGALGLAVGVGICLGTFKAFRAEKWLLGALLLLLFAVFALPGVFAVSDTYGLRLGTSAQTLLVYMFAEILGGFLTVVGLAFVGLRRMQHAS